MRHPRALIAIAVGLLAAAVLPFASIGAAHANASSALGVYTGGGNVNGVHQFETWLGRKVATAEDFVPGDSWSSIAHPDWLASTWSGTGYRLVLGVPMLPPSGADLATGATGAYNTYFTQLAQTLVAHGESDAVLRLGWEFTGNWYPWHASACTSCFASYWRQIVGAMRAVPGAHFAFDWNVTGGWESYRVEDAYPGDDVVDYIGMDIYDQTWDSAGGDPAVRWHDVMTGDYSLVWHRDFAAAHGKPMTFPEWGLSIRDDGHGGGDAPYFIQQMHDWINGNNVAYAIYFEFTAPDGDHCLECGAFPQGAALFRQLFGASTTTTTGVLPPTTTTTVPPSITFRATSRVAGPDRVATAIAVSQRRPSASTVVVASSQGFADALVAGPLAASLDAPVLLNGPGDLETRVAAEVARLGATNAVVVGGPGAVDPKVDADLEWMHVPTRRLAGANRYGTAAAVVAAMPSSPQVLVASGEQPADALSAGALGVPVLLTAQDHLPAVTAAALGSSQVTVVGGPAAVSPSVLPDAPRLAGSDRYATSAAVADYGVAHGRYSATTVSAASGVSYADAVVAGALRQPLLLVAPDSLDSSPASRDWLVAHRGQSDHAVVLGGTAALSVTTQTQIELALA